VLCGDAHRNAAKSPLAMCASAGLSKILKGVFVAYFAAPDTAANTLCA
jgi:hypothetical protein